MIELLVVIAIIAILASLLLPALSRAKEKAKVAKVHAGLYGIEMALPMDADDHGGKVPPVRENCNPNLQDHGCQLPVELADGRHLPRQKEREIIEGHPRVYHGHIVLSIPPKHSVAQVVGFEGEDGYSHRPGVCRETAELCGAAVWARGYRVSTVGRDETAVRRYMQEQKKKISGWIN